MRDCASVQRRGGLARCRDREAKALESIGPCVTTVGVAPAAVDGRLLLFLSKDAATEPRFQVSATSLSLVQVFGVDVHDDSAAARSPVKAVPPHYRFTSKPQTVSRMSPQLRENRGDSRGRQCTLCTFTQRNITHCGSSACHQKPRAITKLEKPVNRVNPWNSVAPETRADTRIARPPAFGQQVQARSCG